MNETNAKLYLGFINTTSGEIIPLNVTNVKEDLSIIDINDIANNILGTTCLRTSNNLPVNNVDYIYYLKTSTEATEF